MSKPAQNPSQSTASSKWMTWGLIGSAILLLVAVGSALLRNNDNYESNPLNETSFKMLDGSSKRLSDYKGKVVILDLWATWCGPCKAEIPHLIELANSYRDQGVEVIGLTNEDPNQHAELVRQFSQQFKINYPIGWADLGIATQLMKINGRGGIPQTFIIGRDGQVKDKFVGFHPAISPPQIKAALDKAVKG